MGAGSFCGKATPWALPAYTCRLYYLVEGIWKPSGLLCLFRTGLPNAEEISLCSTNFPKLRISATGSKARLNLHGGRRSAQACKLYKGSQPVHLVANTGLILPVPLARAWPARAGPGDDPLIMGPHSTVCETFGLAKRSAEPQLHRVEEPATEDTVLRQAGAVGRPHGNDGRVWPKVCHPTRTFRPDF